MFNRVNRVFGKGQDNNLQSGQELKKFPNRLPKSFPVLKIPPWTKN